MARPRRKANESAFVLYDVFYEDGSRLSNRRVPRELVGTLDGDEPVLAALKAQDDEIAAKSGRPRGPIKRISRVPD
jgi:hypothetical protein